MENFETLIKQLKEREFKGALIDTYVAGEFLELQDDSVRINKIIDYDSHYGIVFGGQVKPVDLMSSFTWSCTLCSSTQRQDWHNASIRGLVCALG